MARKEFTRKIRKAAIDRAAGHCEKCRAVLKKGEAEVDHILEDQLGGEPVLANAQVLCKPCHKTKTAERVAMMRKAERARDKASGAIRPAGNIQGKPFSRPERALAREARAVTKLPLPPRQLFWRASNNPEIRDAE